MTVFNEFKEESAASYLEGADIRAALLMNTTTADTENDGIVSLADFTTLARSDATGYSDVALTGEDVVKDDANDRAQFNVDTFTFSGLSGDASNDYAGVLIYKFDTNDAGSTPIRYIAFSSEQSASSTSVQVTASNGLLRFT